MIKSKIFHHKVHKVHKGRTKDRGKFSCIWVMKSHDRFSVSLCLCGLVCISKLPMVKPTATKKRTTEARRHRGSPISINK